jgi:hypothetical protein
MPLTLRNCVNRTTLISIPLLFGDNEARSCRIVATEVFGVWLVSDELSARVLPRARHGADKSAAAQAIFVPFAQIAAIVPVASTPSAATGLKPASAASVSAPAASVPAAAAAPSPGTSRPRAGNTRGNPAARTSPPKTSGTGGV